MKICSIIIQNKRGQNLFVVSSNDYSHELSLQYSKDIYNYILSQIKAGKKIDRSLVLDSNFLCICNVNKDAIFLVIVQKSELFLGYEAIKKLTEFYGTYFKQEITTRKYQETLLILEEFLYTKEFLPQKLTFNFIKQTPISSRCLADCDHLHKFSSLQATMEKNLIANIPIKYAKKQQTIERSIDIINQFIKPIGQIQQYEQNIEEQQWKQQYKTSLYDCAFKLKSKQVHKENINNKYKLQKVHPSYKQNTTKQSQIVNQYMSISSSDIQMMRLRFLKPTQQTMNNNLKQSQVIFNQIEKPKQINLYGDGEKFQPIEETQIQKQSSSEDSNKKKEIQQKNIKQQNSNNLLDLDDNTNNQNEQISTQNQTAVPDLSFLSFSPLKQQNEPVLKMIEKMIIAQKDGRLKELKIFGQVALEGDFTGDDQSNLQLLGPYWLDVHGCQRRITPNSLELQQLNENNYKMIIKNANYKTPKGIIDYIIPAKAFTQQRIPIIFLYRLEQQQSFASYCLQYKVNDQWQVPLFDVNIEINLEKDVEYEDLKTMPVAQTITDKQIIWKTKQLMQQQKGRLILNVTGIKKQGQQILNHIKITLRANTSVIENMECIMFYNSQEQKCQKKLSVEYKIYPNS